MNKFTANKKLGEAFCIISLVICLMFSLSSCGQTEIEKEDNFYKLPPNVITEMLQADYWLGNNSDKVIMTLEEIEAFNKDITKKDETRTKDITAYGETVSLQEVMSHLPDVEFSEEGNFANGKAMEKGYMELLHENRNFQAWEGKEEVVPQYAVAVTRTNLRILPTSDFISSEGDTIYDEMQSMELYWNQPVIVLNESLDKRFYFVQCPYNYGWVKAEDLAFFQEKQEWIDWQKPENFLVVSTSRIRLDTDTKDSRVSEQEVYLGNVLPIAKTTADMVAGRSTYNNYVIEMPVRGIDGNVEFVKTLVPANAGVHEGFLPYTERNTLELAFTMLGQNYGWGGLDKSNDCSGYLKQIYSAMGFRIPRDSGPQAEMPCTTIDISGMKEEEKTDTIGKIPAGSLLQFPGHIVMYLGERDGKLYVINSVGLWFSPETEERENVLSVVVNDLSVKRSDLGTWLSHLETIKIIDGE